MNDKEKISIEHLVQAYDAYVECGTSKMWEEKELFLLMDYFAVERQYERSFIFFILIIIFLCVKK